MYGTIAFPDIICPWISGALYIFDVPENSDYLNNNWPGHKVILVAFHDNYGKDSFNARLLSKVSEPPKMCEQSEFTTLLLKKQKTKETKENTKTTKRKSISLSIQWTSLCNDIKTIMKPLFFSS